MFIPRADGESDNCPSGYSNCTPMFAIVGTDPAEKESNTKNFGPPDYEKPGPHRYIGIGMVAGMIFVVFLLWMSCAKWPRRKLKECGLNRQTQEEKIVQVMGERKEESDIVKPPEVKRRGPRSGHSRGMDIKPASVSVFSETTTRRSIASNKAIQHMMDWELERVHGVRYEARTPKRDCERCFDTINKPPRAAHR